MESNFDEYIRRSNCLMMSCPYENESLDCIDCINRMIAEHDSEIIKNFLEDIVDYIEFNCDDISRSDCVKYDNCDKCKLDRLLIKFNQKRELKNE